MWNGDGDASIYLNNQAEQAATASNSSSSLPGSTVGGSTSGNFMGSGSSSSSVPGVTDDIAKSTMGIDIDFAKIYDSVISKIVNYLNYVFEPVQHTFTIEVMSNHIQNISLLLFILTAILLIFFISLLFNITLFLFSERLMSYFTNKYILWYLKFNKKLIAFEIIILSGWIGYLLYVLLKGLHYLGTHPVIYSSIGG
jgi:hypothetical protein